jgi:hypothetical protein
MRRAVSPCMRLPTLGLTPTQIAVVTAVFVFTLLGALALAFALRWWNQHKRVRKLSPRQDRRQSKPNRALPLAHSRAASRSASSSGSPTVSLRSRVARKTASVTGELSITPQCVVEAQATVPNASWPCHSTTTCVPLVTAC